jgi:hypothetical protein
MYNTYLNVNSIDDDKVKHVSSREKKLPYFDLFLMTGRYHTSDKMAHPHIWPQLF